MSGVFELAVSTLRADSDPVYPVRRALPANKTRHKRPFAAEEIGELLRDVAEHGGRHETIAAFRLMWLRLCRPGEVAEAQWAEFVLDAALWRIPAERMKKRKEHVTPLPEQAVVMLRALHGITGRHAHVFPGRDDRAKPMAAASFRQALNVLGWSGKYSPHASPASRPPAFRRSGRFWALLRAGDALTGITRAEGSTCAIPSTTDAPPESSRDHAPANRDPALAMLTAASKRKRHAEKLGRSGHYD